MMIVIVICDDDKYSFFVMIIDADIVLCDDDKYSLMCGW